MIISLKVDVDTARGTQKGVPNLLNLFAELNIPATFLFSLGPDNTGRAMKRIFRAGFFKKVSRSSVLSTYGLKTLLNGLLWPGPDIAKHHGYIMQKVAEQQHETGIHCYDHVFWQDNVHKLSRDQVLAEFKKAQLAFLKVFQTHALTAGAAGWQANANSLMAYDLAQLLYASDTRGVCPFFPRIADQIFKTLQIPTTLPTLDELMGRPEYPESRLIAHYLSLLTSDTNKLNIFTLHAEIEGMSKLAWFRQFLLTLQSQGVIFKKMADVAKTCLADRQNIPVCDLIQGPMDGRSGTLAIQQY